MDHSDESSYSVGNGGHLNDSRKTMNVSGPPGMNHTDFSSMPMPLQWKGGTGEVQSRVNSMVSSSPSSLPFIMNPLQSFQRMMSPVSPAPTTFNPLLFSNIYPPSFTGFAPNVSSVDAFRVPLYSQDQQKVLHPMGVLGASLQGLPAMVPSTPYPYLNNPYKLSPDVAFVPINYPFPTSFPRVNPTPVSPFSLKQAEMGYCGVEPVASTQHREQDSSCDQQKLKKAPFVTMGSCFPVQCGVKEGDKTLKPPLQPTLKGPLEPALTLHSGELNRGLASVVALNGRYEQKTACAQQEQSVKETEQLRRISPKDEQRPLISETSTSERSDNSGLQSQNQGLRCNAISTSISNILFDGEKQEWITPVTLECILNDVNALLRLHIEDAVAQPSPSVVDGVCETKNAFTRFKTYTMAQPFVTSYRCAVCWEGVRPKELAYLGDLLVFCNDCGLAVHRRCYGVHRVFVTSGLETKILFLCEYCQQRRVIEKNNSATKRSCTPQLRVTCVVCCRKYDGTGDPEAFHRIQNVERTWVHTYCALVTKEHISIHDLRSMDAITLTQELPSFSATPSVLGNNISAACKSECLDEQEKSDPDISDNSSHQITHRDPLKDESPPKSLGGCVFCLKSTGFLVQCVSPGCSTFMHLFCLRRQIYIDETEEKNTLGTSLTVQLGSLTTDNSVCYITPLCFSHLTAPCYCSCRQPFQVANDQSVMVGCDVCGDWLHGSCIGTVEVTRAMQSEYYQCLRCCRQSVYLRCLDALWACYPLEQERSAACRQLLTALYAVRQDTQVFPGWFLFENIVPPHVCPLPFPDMILLSFAWQWRCEAFLLVDRLIPVSPVTSRSESFMLNASLQTTHEVSDKATSSVTKRLQLNKKLALCPEKMGPKCAELSSSDVGLPRRTMDKAFLKGTLRYKGSDLRAKAMKKKITSIVPPSMLSSEHTSKLPTALRIKKKKLGIRKGVAILPHDAFQSQNKAVLSGSVRDTPLVSRTGSTELDTDLDMIDGTSKTQEVANGGSICRGYGQSGYSLLPVCRLADLNKLLALKDAFPMAMGEWTPNLSACIARCERWISGMKSYLDANDIKCIEKCLGSQEKEAIQAFLCTKRQGGSLDTGDGGLSFLGLPEASLGNRKRKSDDDGNYVMGAMAMLTTEAVELRVQGATTLFLEEASPWVFSMPVSSLSVVKIKRVMNDIYKTPELVGLKSHPIYQTCKNYLSQIQECQVKARQMKSSREVQLEEVRALVHTVRNDLPSGHQIDVTSLAELMVKGTDLEEKVAWKNLRSIRDTVNQAQQMGITSETLKKLQALLRKIDAWRKDYQRFVSFVKTARLTKTGTTQDDAYDERRNVVVSGRSGFLKDLFGTSDTGSNVLDKTGNTRSELDNSGVIYTQSQSLEDAMELFHKKSQFDVQCDEVNQLDEWISLCEEWIAQVKSALGTVGPQLLPRDACTASDTEKLDASGWDLATMEDLLRRKVDLPLAVPVALVTQLEERVDELKRVEERVVKAACGLLMESERRTDGCWGISKPEMRQLLDHGRRLVDGLAQNTSSRRRGSTLQKCFQMLTKHLKVFEAWEHIVVLSLKATDFLLVLDNSLHFQEFRSVLSCIGESLQADPLEYPPSHKCVFNYHTPLVNISCLCKDSQWRHNEVQEPRELRDAICSSLQFRELCSKPLDCTLPACVDARGKDSAAQDDVDVNLFEDQQLLSPSQETGLDWIAAKWDALQHLATTQTEGSLDLRRAVVEWASLVAVHFVMLCHPHTVHSHAVYGHFACCVADLLVSITTSTKALFAVLLPSSSSAVHGYIASREKRLGVQDGSNDCTAPSVLLWGDDSLVWNYFLVACTCDTLTRLFTRLVCFWMLLHSSSLAREEDIQNDRLVQLGLVSRSCFLTTEEDTLKEPATIASLDSSRPFQEDSNERLHGVSLCDSKREDEVSGTVTNLKMLHILRRLCDANAKNVCMAPQCCTASTHEYIRDHHTLEEQHLERLKSTTWSLRAHGALTLLTEIKDSGAYAPECCLTEVMRLLGETRDSNACDNTPLYDELSSYVAQYTEWVDAAKRCLCAPSVCFLGVPQLTLANERVLTDSAAMVVACGMSSNTAEDSMKHPISKVVLTDAELGDVAWQENLDSFLRDEREFRQRWLHDSLTSDGLVVSTNDSFQADLLTLQNDVLCIGALRQIHSDSGAGESVSRVTALPQSSDTAVIPSTLFLDYLMQPSCTPPSSTPSVHTDCRSSLSTVEMPLFFGSVEKPTQTTQQRHAPWCFFKSDAAAHQSLPTSVRCSCTSCHVEVLRDLYTVFFQGYVVGPLNPALATPYSERVFSADDMGAELLVCDPLYKLSGARRSVWLHRQSINGYRCAQRVIALEYVRRTKHELLDIQRILMARPHLCFEQHDYLQLLKLRSQFVECAQSALYLVLTCVGVQVSDVDDQTLLGNSPSALSFCSIEHMEQLLVSVSTLREKLAPVASRLVCSEDTCARRIVGALGVRITSDSSLDFQHVGGFLQDDIRARLLVTRSRLESLRRYANAASCIQAMNAVRLWNLYVSPYFFAKNNKESHPTSLTDQVVALDILATRDNYPLPGGIDHVVRAIDTLKALNNVMGDCHVLEEFFAVVLMTLLLWCLRHNEQHHDLSGYTGGYRYLLHAVPAGLLQLIKSTNDPFQAVSILPFWHLTQEFGVMRLRVHCTDGIAHNSTPQAVLILSHILLWVAFSVDLAFLRDCPLSALLPVNSSAYAYFVHLMEKATHLSFDAYSGFLSQLFSSLHAVRQRTRVGVSEALALPFDILEWRFLAVQYLLPSTIPYERLKELMETKVALDERLKRQDQYCYSFNLSQPEVSCRVSLSDRQHTLKRWVPLGDPHVAARDVVVTKSDALSWICTTAPVVFRDSNQVTPHNWSKHYMLEAQELLTRYELAVVAINKLQVQLHAAKTPFKGSSSAPTSTARSCIAMPHVINPILCHMYEQRVAHWTVENVLMYFEDLTLWHTRTCSALQTLEKSRQYFESRLSGIPPTKGTHNTTFNRWGFTSPSQWGQEVQHLWNAYGLGATPSSQDATKLAPHRGLCLDTFQILHRQAQELHCGVAKGLIVSSLTEQLEHLITALLELQKRGDHILHCLDTSSAVAQSDVATPTDRTPTRVTVDDIEDFLRQSLFVRLPSHDTIKQQLRRYIELEVLATHAFTTNHSRVTPQMPCFAPGDTLSLLHAEMYEGAEIPRPRLVYELYRSTQGPYCAVSGTCRTRTLQQCWISATRCAMKGLYGTLSSDVPSDTVQHLNTIPLKTLQALYGAGRDLFGDSPNIPPEFQHLRVLLGAAKQFLVEARTSLDAWIKLRLMVQYYPIYAGEEIELIQNKLQKKFPTICIKLVTDNDHLKEIHVYKDKQLKSVYVPPAPLLVKNIPKWSSSFSKLDVVGTILHQASTYPEPSYVAACYDAALHHDQLKTLFESHLRGCARQHLHQLYPEGSASHAEDREQLLFDTADSALNAHYFQALQDMTLKRLQQNTSVRAVGSESAVTVPDTSLASSSVNILLGPRSRFMMTSEPAHLSTTLFGHQPPDAKSDTPSCERLNPRLSVSTPHSQSASPASLFASSIQLNPLQAMGFLWRGLFYVDSDVASPPSNATQGFQGWLVPLFSPVPEPLVMFLRQCTSMVLHRTMDLQQFATYANPIYAATAPGSVKLFNVILAADWTAAVVNPTHEFIRKRLRPQSVRVVSDAPKSQMSLEDIEALEQKALNDSVQVLCFSACPSTHTQGSPTIRLWIVPPEPLLTEPLLCTQFPKSSQLVFAALEVGSELAPQEDCVNMSLSTIRESTARVSRMLEEQEKLTQLGTLRPPFSDLLFSLSPTVIQWMLRHNEDENQQPRASTQPSSPTHSCCSVDSQHVSVAQSSVPPAGDTTEMPSYEHPAGGSFRIPKRPKHHQAPHNVAPAAAYSRHPSPRFIVNPPCVQQSVPASQYVRSTRPSPLMKRPHFGTPLPQGGLSRALNEPRSVSIRHSFPPWQRHHQRPSVPSQAFIPQQDAHVVHRVVRPLSITPDPYGHCDTQHVAMPSQPVVLSAESVREVAPWRDVNDVRFQDAALPPWKQHKAHSEPTLPFKVPQALKSLIQGAAAKLRLKRSPDASLN